MVEIRATRRNAVIGAVNSAAASTFADTITAPAWKTKPGWCRISSNDQMIAPENQQRMSARIGARKVITLEASHASLMSRPKDVAALIDEAAIELGVG